MPERIATHNVSEAKRRLPPSNFLSDWNLPSSDSLLPLANMSMDETRSSKFDRYTTAEIVARAFASEINGKNVIITGTSIDGLGAESARVISKHAALVIITGRSDEKLRATVDWLKAEGAKSEIRTLKFDLASLESTRKAAAEVNAYTEPIHVLMNNAAYRIVPEFEKSVDGHEIQFAAGHLAPFLFTNLIKQKLKTAATLIYHPRVVFLSSGAHLASDIRYDDPAFSDGKEYKSRLAYGQTKTGNALTAVELARRWKSDGILAFALHPGVYGSPLNLTQPLEDKVAIGVLDKDGNHTSDHWRTLGECTATQVLACFDPALDSKSGSYLRDCQIYSGPSLGPHACDPENAKKCFEFSSKLVGASF